MLTKTYVSASTGKTILSAATPVFDKSGNVVGVAGIDVVIETIMNFMQDYTIGANGYAMLLADDGTFVYHPNSDLIDKSLQDINISSRVGQAVTDKATKLITYSVDGSRKHGYIMPIGETGFIVLSCIPAGQYYSSLILAIIMLLVVMAIGVVFILFLIGRLTGKIVKPLEELNGAAIELANGNFDVNIDVHSEDEVGELGNSIDKTVTRLKEYIDYIDYIDEISEVLANMADGKLAIHLKYAYVGEFQKVKDALNHISESMTDVMTNIVEGANQVSVGSDDLAKQPRVWRRIHRHRQQQLRNFLQQQQQLQSR